MAHGLEVENINARLRANLREQLILFSSGMPGFSQTLIPSSSRHYYRRIGDPIRLILFLLFLHWFPSRPPSACKEEERDCIRYRCFARHYTTLSLFFPFNFCFNSGIIILIMWALPPILPVASLSRPLSSRSLHLYVWEK